MKAYLKRSNNIPSSSLKWNSPLDKRAELLLKDYGIIEEKGKRIKNIVIKILFWFRFFVSLNFRSRIKIKIFIIFIKTF